MIDMIWGTLVAFKLSNVTVYVTGADLGVSFRGAQKIMCLHAHYERGTELTFGRGPGPA